MLILKHFGEHNKYLHIKNANIQNFQIVAFSNDFKVINPNELKFTFNLL